MPAFGGWHPQASPGRRIVVWVSGRHPFQAICFSSSSNKPWASWDSQTTIFSSIGCSRCQVPSQSPDHKALARCQATFCLRFDTDHDGKLSFIEFASALGARNECHTSFLCRESRCELLPRLAIMIRGTEVAKLRYCGASSRWLFCQDEKLAFSFQIVGGKEVHFRSVHRS